ncbi:hypothetical protein BATR1942_04470 [Bacillus atrophaeus 1942]|uniref:Uncharacterized protein n=1 Tax=Bacillus atrophaeus (strain 1942) TaxID=720555 RepID=A0ABM5LVS5_BACA1|nr:hypothetical protein BATR1942_04470 [Bacillus atrophaeus 1942]
MGSGKEGNMILHTIGIIILLTAGILMAIETAANQIKMRIRREFPANMPIDLFVLSV